MLFRLAYLTVTNTFAVLRLLPMSDRDKDDEILTLRHQLAVLQRQLGPNAVMFTPVDRAFLAALLHPVPREVLRRLQLLVRPDTILRWHRDLMKRRHATISQRKRRGRPPTVCSIRSLVLRLVRENPSWGYRRIHGELATLGIKIAASTVWEILRAEGIDPAPDRAASTWADFLRSQAHALLAVDFIETVTLTGQRQYILAAIEHATRRVRVLGTTAHPTAVWVTQAARNLAMDLDDAGVKVRYLIRDRDAKFPALFDRILTDTGIQIVLSGVRVPRMNSIMERWVRTCRRELLDRTLIWNETHLRHCLHQFELHYNRHRPHQAIHQAAPLRAVPPPITDPERLARLDVRRNDRLGGGVQVPGPGVPPDAGGGRRWIVEHSEGYGSGAAKRRARPYASPGRRDRHTPATAGDRGRHYLRQSRRRVRDAERGVLGRFLDPVQGPPFAAVAHC